MTKTKKRVCLSYRRVFTFEILLGIITVWDLLTFLNRVIPLSHEQWNDYAGEEAGGDYEDRYLPTHSIGV